MASGYRLLTYDSAPTPRAGLLINGTVYDAARATGTPSDETVLGILADWPSARRRLAACAKTPDARAVVSSPRLLAPVLFPGAIYCAGANYSDHVLEMANAQNIAPDPDPHTLGLKAWHFMKPPRSVVGPDTDVPLPPTSRKVDWEAELALVIGRKATNVPLAEALDYVAGYTVANDLSARDLATRQAIAMHSPFRLDWLAHKGFDGACPLGPWIVPAEDIADPQQLAIELSVNGVIKQQSNTSRMIFTVAEQISDLSHKCSLYPGDLILTGTPAGVGAGHNEFLKAGDRIDVRISSIGELSTRVV